MCWELGRILILQYWILWTIQNTAQNDIKRMLSFYPRLASYTYRQSVAPLIRMVRCTSMLCSNLQLMEHTTFRMLEQSFRSNFHGCQ